MMIFINSTAYEDLALGAKVIATASTAHKLEVCTKYGKADHAIDYSKPGWQQEVLKLTNGKGVGKRYLSLIEQYLADEYNRCDIRPGRPHQRYQSHSLSIKYLTSCLDSLKCIAWKGRALVVGFAGGQIEKV
jgi:NADPH:quinone reductase